MEGRPWVNPHYGYQRPPPPSGHFNSPPRQIYPPSVLVPTPSPPPLPPGFRPLPDGKISSFYHSGFQMPPPSVPFHYPPPGFNGMGQNPFHNSAASCSPVAGMGRGPPGTGWRPSYVSVSQRPNFLSPGITPSIKTPDVQEVRKDRVPHLNQACQSQQRAERSKDYILVMENVSSTVQGVGSTMLQKPTSSERIKLERPAVADDQEKENQDQESHPQGEVKAEMQMEQISVSDYACSTAEGGGTSKGRIQELISSERIELEAPLGADSQNESRQGIIHLGQPSQAQDKSREQCNKTFMVKESPDADKGYIGQGKSQEFTSSMRDESEALLLADFQEGRQAQASDQMQTSPEKAKAKRQQDQMSTMGDASNTSEGGEIRERKLQKLASSEKNELESARVVLGEVDNTVAPTTSSSHDKADSCSLTSSMLDWVSTFDDVSSTGEMYWGANGMMVKVGDYFVNQKQSAIMDAIIKKHGDIAKDCRNSSTMFRSYAVQGVCEVVEGLQIPLEQLSHDRLKTYTCFVKEALVMGLDVEWLEERLDEVSETIDSMKEYKRVRDAQKANAEKMKDLKEEIEVKDAEKWRCGNEVEKLWCLFEEATLEVEQKKSAIDDIKSRYKALPKGLLHGLY